MSYKMKVILLSLIPLVVVFGIIFWNHDPRMHLASLNFVVVLMVAIVEALLLFIVAMVIKVRRVDSNVSEADQIASSNSNRAKMKAFLLAAGVVLLVGGSLCFGGAALS